MISALRSLSYSIKHCSKTLWILTLAVSAFSLTLLKSVSTDESNFFAVQFAAILAGIAGALIIQSVNYKNIADNWIWVAIFCTLLIVYTLFFGIAVEGSSGVNARAWIKLPGGVTFQPSELVKIGFIVTFSKHLSILLESEKIKSFPQLVLVAVHALVPAVFTHLQGDDGAAIIFLCMAIFMAFIAGIQIRYFFLVGVLGALLMPVVWKYVLADYQRQRIINQLNPESDPLNMGYQQIQGKLSIGSGGLTGCGLFQGPRVANGAVPIQESDFIFSVAGEELGFVGCISILFLLLCLILKVLSIAKKSRDSLGTIMCFGFAGLVLSQTIFNLGMCLSLLPVMGVTLPFFSAGGSSAACLYLGIGIAQSVFLSYRKYKPDHRNVEYSKKR